MGIHEDYGKQVLHLAAGNLPFSDNGEKVNVNYGTPSPARIDGTIGKNIAVEVESRTSKQVRGAVLDLISHRFPKKLLILIPANMNNADTTARQCEFILKRFLRDSKDYRVVVLAGTGNDQQLQADALRIKRAIDELSA